MNWAHITRGARGQIRKRRRKQRRVGNGHSREGDLGKLVLTLQGLAMESIKPTHVPTTLLALVGNWVSLSLSLSLQVLVGLHMTPCHPLPSIWQSFYNPLFLFGPHLNLQPLSPFSFIYSVFWRSCLKFWIMDFLGVYKRKEKEKKRGINKLGPVFVLFF